ncbi:adenylate kinase [Gryllotalpicola reticulitermitis]|uniref:Adenylate kinase n=1 Tax=Gryllotalpicola reticulitermitis TaxID=1184153 RepID=A0ABV8Q372_9MICO
MTEAVTVNTRGGARLLIVGPPGAGKGTQAAFISESFAIPAVSTGDIFRDNIKNETPLGLKVKEITSSGGYVPDELTNEIVADRLSQADAASGFLLDGFPRTTGQVGFLDDWLSSNDTQLDAVIQLVADTDHVVERLLKRAAEQGRADDTEEVIRQRLAIYEEQTAPLIDVYSERDLVVTVDGLGTVDEVAQRILAGLSARGIRPAAAA